MTDLLADWWVHEVSIERYTGSDIDGDNYAAPETCAAFVDDRRRLIVTGTGAEETSSMTVYLPSTIDDVPLDSRVTLPATFGSRVSQVIAVSRHDAGALDTPNHVELALL